MKKLILIMLIISLSLTACGKKEETDSLKNEKDISILLSTIGQNISTVEKLGDLPEPQVAGLSRMYYTKDIQGFFSGFNMGIQLENDGKTVKQIYINPHTALIRVNGFLIGATVEEMEKLFGKVEANISPKIGQTYYVTFKDESYSMRCTVEEQRVEAVAFELLSEGQNGDNQEDPDSYEDFIGEYRNMDRELVGLLGTKLIELEEIREKMPILEMVTGFDFQKPVDEKGYNIIYWVDRSKVDGTTHHINQVALVKNDNYQEEETKLITMGVHLNMPVKQAEDAIVEVPSVKDPLKPETHRLKTDFGDLDDDGFVDIIYLSYR